MSNGQQLFTKVWFTIGILCNYHNNLIMYFIKLEMLDVFSISMMSKPEQHNSRAIYVGLMSSALQGDAKYAAHMQMSAYNSVWSLFYHVHVLCTWNMWYMLINVDLLCIHIHWSCLTSNMTLTFNYDVSLKYRFTFMNALQLNHLITCVKNISNGITNWYYALIHVQCDTCPFCCCIS